LPIFWTSVTLVFFDHGALHAFLLSRHSHVAQIHHLELHIRLGYEGLSG
jgi:hypothetical protein